MIKLNKEEIPRKFDEYIFYIDDLFDEIIEQAKKQGFNFDFSSIESK